MFYSSQTSCILTANSLLICDEPTGPGHHTEPPLPPPAQPPGSPDQSEQEEEVEVSTSAASLSLPPGVKENKKEFLSSLQSCLYLCFGGRGGGCSYKKDFPALLLWPTGWPSKKTKVCCCFGLSDTQIRLQRLWGTSSSESRCDQIP